MKTRYIAALTLVATLGAWPSSYGAPPGPTGTQVVRFRSINDFANGTNNCAGNVCVGFGAQVTDDLNGVPQGTVSASFFDLNTSQFAVIQCSGPTYANSLSIVHGNGNSTIRATLDPSAVDCFAFNVFAPVTLDLIGRDNGTFHVSNSGSFTQKFSGQVVNGHSRSDQFAETFDGTIGSLSGPLEGNAGTFRMDQHERVQ